MLKKIIHRLEDFLLPLTKTKHEATFGCHLSLNHILSFLQNGQRPTILSPATNQWSQSLNGFNIMIKYVGASFHHHFESPVLIVEVRH